MHLFLTFFISSKTDTVHRHCIILTAAAPAKPKSQVTAIIMNDELVRSCVVYCKTVAGLNVWVRFPSECAASRHHYATPSFTAEVAAAAAAPTPGHSFLSIFILVQNVARQYAKKCLLSGE